MELPEYNAPKEELLAFIEGLMEKYSKHHNVHESILYYDLNSWQAVVNNDGSRGKQFLFNDADRERLFKWLREMKEKGKI